MSNTTTTSIRLSLDKFMKIKSEKINLSQLVEKFLDDYFVETEEDFDLLELKKQEKNIAENIKVLKDEQLKLLSAIKRKESIMQDHKEELESQNLYTIANDEELKFWVDTVELLKKKPELKMGRHQYYKNIIRRINVLEFESKLEWFTNEYYPKYLDEQKKLEDE